MKAPVPLIIAFFQVACSVIYTVVAPNRQMAAENLQFWMETTQSQLSRTRLAFVLLGSLVLLSCLRLVTQEMRTRFAFLTPSLINTPLCTNCFNTSPEITIFDENIFSKTWSEEEDKSLLYNVNVENIQKRSVNGVRQVRYLSYSLISTHSFLHSSSSSSSSSSSGSSSSGRKSTLVAVWRQR